MIKKSKHDGLYIKPLVDNSQGGCSGWYKSRYENCHVL